jgi:hypothetical protein
MGPGWKQGSYIPTTAAPSMCTSVGKFLTFFIKKYILSLAEIVPEKSYIKNFFKPFQTFSIDAQFIIFKENKNFFLL